MSPRVAQVDFTDKELARLIQALDVTQWLTEDAVTKEAHNVLIRRLRNAREIARLEAQIEL